MEESDPIYTADKPTLATKADVANAKAEAIQAAGTNAEQSIIDATLGVQEWLPAVATFAELPITIPGTNVSWLCRVIADPDSAKVGVWQAIPNGVDDTAVWTFFSNNQDAITHTELANALTDKKNNITYSTTEQLTGDTWTDGKPIYRRVGTFNKSIPAGHSFISDASLDWSANIDTVVSQEFELVYNRNLSLQFRFSFQGNSYGSLVTYNDSSATSVNVRYIVEYTLVNQ